MLYVILLDLDLYIAADAALFLTAARAVAACREMSQLPPLCATNYIRVYIYMYTTIFMFVFVEEGGALFRTAARAFAADQMEASSPPLMGESISIYVYMCVPIYLYTTICLFIYAEKEGKEFRTAARAFELVERERRSRPRCARRAIHQ